MSTPNFSYVNRCIVVSSDALEWGNHPELENTNVGDRSYPSYIIPAGFRFYDVLLTYGYYEAACIDYQEKDDESWECLLGYRWRDCPTTKKEFFSDMKYWFKLSEYRFRKLCNGIKRENFKYEWDFTDALCEAVGIYLMEQEEQKVNEYLDKMIEDYGFTEYVCCEIFSNGEAFYTPKKTQGREALLQAVAS